MLLSLLLKAFVIATGIDNVAIATDLLTTEGVMMSSAKKGRELDSGEAHFKSLHLAVIDFCWWLLCCLLGSTKKAGAETCVFGPSATSLLDATGELGKGVASHSRRQGIRLRCQVAWAWWLESTSVHMNHDRYSGAPWEDPLPGSMVQQPACVQICCEEDIRRCNTLVKAQRERSHVCLEVAFKRV
eukprot:4617509-Amphidinium_carterae.1